MEIKLIAYRKTKDGEAATFLLHPNDATIEVRDAPIGTVFDAEFKVSDQSND